VEIGESGEDETEGAREMNPVKTPEEIIEAKRKKKNKLVKPFRHFMNLEGHRKAQRQPEQCPGCDARGAPVEFMAEYLTNGILTRYYECAICDTKFINEYKLTSIRRDRGEAEEKTQTG
jgi:DNA-directed RNA polymerase subunit M/transcription elongation factor TFIIS